MKFPIVSVTRFLREREHVPQRTIKEIYRRIREVVGQDDGVEDSVLKKAFQSEKLYGAFLEKVETFEYREIAERYSHHASRARHLHEKIPPVGL